MLRTFTVALAIVFATTLGGWLPGGLPGQLSAGAAVAQTPEALPEVADIVIGNPDATVELIEYASFTCPHCATFHAGVFKDLKRDYIDTGKIRFVYREVFFDRFGLWAAMVARCAGDDRYMGVAELLYDTQRTWMGSGEPTEVVGNLRRIGRTAGLTDDALDICLQNGPMAQAMVAKFQRDSEADGINSTPSLVLNGTRHGNMNYSELRALLDAELAK
jgi:protein-disulfide isomerase